VEDIVKEVNVGQGKSKLYCDDSCIHLFETDESINIASS
jgi:hypothetical protein